MTFDQIVELLHSIFVRNTLNALHTSHNSLDRIFGCIKTIAQHMFENVFRCAPRLMGELFQTTGISLG